jgi:hypothetical protein
MQKPVLKPLAQGASSKQPIANRTANAKVESETECQKKWLKAEAAGLSYGVAMMGGIPTAVVDESTWNSIDYQTKAGWMETFICTVAGPGKTLAKAQFRSNMTNRVIAEWSMLSGFEVE